MSEKINRTFKYYLKHSKTSQRKLEMVLKISCWLHNHLLKQFRMRDKSKQSQFTKRELQDYLSPLKTKFPFLKEVHSQVLQDVARRVYKVWDKNEELKKLNPKKKYPNFKPQQRYNSLTYPLPIKRSDCGYKLDNSPLTEKAETRKLRLSLGRQNNHNIQILTNIRFSRNIEGDIKTLTIKRKNGRYYACFSCENIPLKPLPKTGNKVGIDMNLEASSYLTLSDGKKYKHPKFYKKSEKELDQANKNLSSKVEGSQNWKDAKLQLAKKWEKVVNQSKHYSYQVANEIVKENDVIKLENLKINNMVRNHCLAKSISQARWGIQRKVIAEAAEIATRQLFLVAPHYTSQKCSNCNELLKEKLTLRDRMFKCWNCFLELDRDVNAAINIRNSEGWLIHSLGKGGEKIVTSLTERGQDIFVS